MTLNDLKKLIYRDNPVADFKGVNKAGIKYTVFIPQHGFFGFLVPLSDIGDATFEIDMPAKLLIRWLIYKDETR